jgi:amino acid transporter
MSFTWALVIVVVAPAIAITAILLVRRGAPEGGYYADGDRAAGVFGVIATGFSVLLGLIVFLAFSSYDEARTGAETEALVVGQQFETAQFMPPAVRGQLSDELNCYARYVIYEEWPRLEKGAEADDAINPWSIDLFRTLKLADPKTVAEQTAYDKWHDQRADREEARGDRVHGAVGIIPGTLWLVLLFTSAVIFGFMLGFADRAERAHAQAVQMGAVVAVLTAMLVLISFLDDAFTTDYGGLRPVAMERTLSVLVKERAILGERTPLPCDEMGRPTPS